MARAYAPGEVAVVVGGFPLTNFGPDTFVSVEYNEDASTLQVGVDGEAAISFNKNLSGRFTLTLMQTSESNDVLMGIFAAFKASKTLVPVIIKDINGRAVHAAEKAWPVRIPTVNYAKEAGTVEWVFETDKLISFVGGSNIL